MVKADLKRLRTPTLEQKGLYEGIFDFLFSQVPDDQYADNRPNGERKEQKDRHKDGQRTRPSFALP